MGQTTIFRRDAHRSAGQRSVMIDAAASVGFQRWTGMTVKFCDQSVDALIGPTVEQIGMGQLWERGLHGSGLFGGALFDTMAVIRWKAGESLLEGVDVEEGYRKGADATAGATESARNFTEQGGSCPLEPVVGFSIDRSRGGRSGT
jgi:hypothetical protein